MKVLYLFNGRPRIKIVNDIENGLNHDGSVYGMSRMKKYGVDVDYVELEKTFSPTVASWLRKKVLNVYFDHLPFLFKFFKYDLVFSTTAFGSQFLRTLIPLKRPLWVMFGVSISGLLGQEIMLKQKLFKWMVGKSSGIVTVGKEEAEVLKNKFPHLSKNIESMLYPVDTKFFSPQDIVEEHQILTVGVDPGRDYKTFFNSCKNLGVKIVVATDPSRLKFFLPLPEQVEAKKYSPLDLVAEYAKSKVVVLPLNTKGGFNDAMGCSTIVEAMAMGKAIVCTKTPTMESFISHGVNGLLVTEGDDLAMKEAVKRLLEDPKMRHDFGVRARKFVVENCDTELFVANLASFFKQVYNG